MKYQGSTHCRQGSWANALLCAERDIAVIRFRGVRSRPCLVRPEKICGKLLRALCLPLHFLTHGRLRAPELGSILLLLHVGSNPIRNLWRVFKVHMRVRRHRFAVRRYASILRSRSVNRVSFDSFMASGPFKRHLAVLAIINSSSVRMTRTAHETLKVFISVISQMSHASIVSTLGYAVRSTIIAAWL